MDSIILIALMITIWVAGSNAPPRQRLRSGLAFCAAGMPVAAYFAANLALFGGLLPVSAEAKQLVRGFALNDHIFRDLWKAEIGRGALLIVPVALGVLMVTGSSFPGRHRRLVIGLTLGFPVVYFSVYALRSDWTLFDWYRYPIPLALLFGSILTGGMVAERLPTGLERWISWALPTLSCAAVVAVALGVGHTRSIGWRPAYNGIYDHARRIAALCQERPGVYAMGDRAGLTAYLLRKPLVQLEGLIADGAMLDHLRRQDPLKDMFLRYGVDYLIVSVPGPPPRASGNCHRVTIPDPYFAGRRTPTMVGMLCSDPIATYFTPQAWSYIFDVRNAPAGR